ncbi:MAG TPA: hypothetical protein VFJ14_03065 [Nocardioidaceae bacterium]|nr:hypothetical protein [Nocardioidaceae bacterium]
MSDDLVFREPWRDLRLSESEQSRSEQASELSEQSERLAQELAAELKPGHPLHGQPTEVIACFAKRDDIMVTRPDGYAIVHLTWRGEAERKPWPLVVFYNSAAAAQAAVNDDS